MWINEWITKVTLLNKKYTYKEINEKPMEYYGNHTMWELANLCEWPILWKKSIEEKLNKLLLLLLKKWWRWTLNGNLKYYPTLIKKFINQEEWELIGNSELNSLEQLDKSQYSEEDLEYLENSVDLFENSLKFNLEFNEIMNALYQEREPRKLNIKLKLDPKPFNHAEFLDFQFLMKTLINLKLWEIEEFLGNSISKEEKINLISLVNSILRIWKKRFNNRWWHEIVNEEERKMVKKSVFEWYQNYFREIFDEIMQNRYSSLTIISEGEIKILPEQFVWPIIQESCL